MAIPVLDFNSLGLNSEGREEDLESPEVQELARKVVEACSTVGFVYLRNHGIAEEEIRDATSTTDEFFSLPVDVKNKYLRTSGEHGWVCMEMERVDPKFKDLKECFNITPYLGKQWPDAVVPGFKEKQMNFYKRCDLLGHRILKALAVGLKIKNLNYFNDAHRSLEKPNRTTLRFLYYPSINQKEIKPDQVRLGEHTDYGSITLLFQDNNGGLEIQNRDETWIPATPIPGTVLVNIGDVMQRWTADRLVSTPHRVYDIPADENGVSKERRSIAFFVHPDEEVMIECIDGSNKYPPISEEEYLDHKLNETY